MFVASKYMFIVSISNSIYIIDYMSNTLNIARSRDTMVKWIYMLLTIKNPVANGGWNILFLLRKTLLYICVYMCMPIFVLLCTVKSYLL